MTVRIKVRRCRCGVDEGIVVLCGGWHSVECVDRPRRASDRADTNLKSVGGAGGKLVPGLFRSSETAKKYFCLL